MASSNNVAFSVIGKTNPAIKAINKLNSTLEKTADVGTKAGEAVKKIVPNGTSSRVKRVYEDLNDMGSGAAKSATKLGMLFSALKRVAFYRAIRTALKEIAQAFQEGTNNLYYYSEALGNIDASHAKGTMDGFATTALYVKNSLGAALMPVLQSLLPIVNAIADGFVWAANAVNQFFHALKGESVFTKAKRYATDYAEALGGASGAAKELKKQIFGFDELNIFNSPSGGGGGGAEGLDYSSMFEEAELEGVFKKIRDIVRKNLGADFGARFKINFKDFFVKWDGLSGEDIAEKILTGFYGILGGVAGFAIGGPVGAIVGSFLGVTLGTYISTIDFNDDGKLSSQEVASMIKDVAAVITGAAIGWTVGGPAGALVGMSVAAGLTALVKTFAPKADATIQAATAAGMIVAVLKTMIKAQTLGFFSAGSTAALLLTAATALTLNVVSLTEFKNKCGSKAEFIGQTIANVLNLIAGAAIGFAFLGVPGAIIGITVAASLNLLINKIGVGYTPQSKRELDNLNQGIDKANMDAYLKFGNNKYDQPASPLNRARGKASGGYVSTGTYFYAGESGPELVGQVGSRTNVTNQAQFTAGMENIMDNTNSVIMQVGSAVVQAIVNKDMTVINNLSERMIVNAYDRGKKLAGTSAVTGSGLL